jgi:hypothetical protein
MVWGDGSSSSPASSGISHTYTDAGVYTGIVSLTQLGNGSSFSCEHVLTGQVNGICGSVSGSVIYDFNNMGDSLTGGSSGLCDSGTVQGFVYDSSTQSWSWNCTGSYAGSSMSCQAWEDSCGDGIVQGAEGEECDSELGCDASCQRYTASCNDVQMILNPAIGVVPFTSVLGMNIPE